MFTINLVAYELSSSVLYSMSTGQLLQQLNSCWLTCHPSCIRSMLSIYDVLVLAYMAIHRAFAACYQFIMHSRNWNGKRNFVHLMQFRSLDVYSEFKSVALRGISNSNTSNHHKTKRKLFANDFAATIAKLKL